MSYNLYENDLPNNLDLKLLKIVNLFISFAIDNYSKLFKIILFIILFKFNFINHIGHFIQEGTVMRYYNN